ncbi:MAG: Glycosyl transferase group 1 [Candidatus Jorgensenbacteria bacterium GW2011_GWF2_41_8]|uniref:Glycosyl transferase group 1 n=1 Tax=Candidatus Jorgensenbacteria bacterium GW2011_GWF2_41_8 TaxID=1618667 RepID=A0A0G0ZSL2_9BACT|nr:MAG: Glycosyl transferase group 1 [Candidatus Jorgensenbacteria bacterium GW2011_GWF2_41_8]
MSEKHTSPLKLFEYMASGRPIVASDLLSLREILTEQEAIFFKPDDPLDLALKIKEILVNQSLAGKSSKLHLAKPRPSRIDFLSELTPGYLFFLNFSAKTT